MNLGLVEMKFNTTTEELISLAKRQTQTYKVLSFDKNHPARGGGSGRFDYSVNPVLPYEILSSQIVGMPSFHL